MASIQLDVVLNPGESVQHAIRELTQDGSVTARVVTEHGPGGGWPLIEFEGTEDELALVEQRYSQPL